MSALKPEAEYPGDLTDDTRWIVAERLLDGQASQQQLAREDYAIWILPAGTRTRALRFNHTPGAGDKEMAGWLCGVWMLRQRRGSVALQEHCTRLCNLRGEPQADELAVRDGCLDVPMVHNAPTTVLLTR